MSSAALGKSPLGPGIISLAICLLGAAAFIEGGLVLLPAGAGVGLIAIARWLSRRAPKPVSAHVGMVLGAVSVATTASLVVFGLLAKS